MAFDPERFRKDFPLLQKEKPPVYFDNACMTLRPRQVISKISEYYEEYPACASRSLHALSKRVDEEVYAARRAVQQFIGAKKDKEIIFLKNTTEAINLVAKSFPFKKGDVVLVSDKEHNSNLLPWQVIAKAKGLELDIIPSDDDNAFSLDNLCEVLDSYEGKVKLVALGMTANLDGVTIPAKEVIRKAHRAGAKVLLDAAQSVPHQELDVRKLDVDFLAFSGHKMLGPSGIGVLYGKESELLSLNLFNVGGETTKNSWYDHAEWEDLPHRFEAGLQHYAGILGLGAAVSYLKKAGLGKVHRHEVSLNEQLNDGLKEIPGAKIIGPENAKLHGGITSFMIDGLNHHDIAMLLSASNDIMIRSGAHCVHSWFNKHGIEGSARASLYLYNTEAEVQVFLDELAEIAKVRK